MLIYIYIYNKTVMKITIMIMKIILVVEFHSLNTYINAFLLLSFHAEPRHLLDQRNKTLLKLLRHKAAELFSVYENWHCQQIFVPCIIFLVMSAHVLFHFTNIQIYLFEFTTAKRVDRSTLFVPSVVRLRKSLFAFSNPFLPIINISIVNIIVSVS